MLENYPENLETTYLPEQAQQISQYFETLSGTEKQIFAVMLHYLRKVFQTVERENLKIKFVSQTQEMMQIAGMGDELEKIEQINFSWEKGAAGFCETYFEANGNVNLEFYPFGKDRSLDAKKTGKGAGMSLFLLSLLQQRIEKIQSINYEPEFMPLIDRGNELGILQKTGTGFSGEVVGRSNLGFVSDDVKAVLMQGNSVNFKSGDFPLPFYEMSKK